MRNGGAQGLTATCGSSWSVRSPSPTAPTTPCLQERDGRWTVQGDPTEGALIVAARKAGLEDEALDARFERVGRSSLLVRAQVDDARFIRTPSERNACSSSRRARRTCCSRAVRRNWWARETRPLTAERRAEILKANEELAGQACARWASPSARCPRTHLKREEVDEGVEQNLVFPGLIGMIDPPREEAKQAVARAKAPAFARS